MQAWNCLQINRQFMEGGEQLLSNNSVNRVEQAIDVVDSDSSAEPVVSQLAVADKRFITIVEDFRDRVSERLVELQHAIEGQSWKQIGDFAHWLKGSAGSVGLDSLSNSGLALQNAVVNKDIESCRGAYDDIESLQRRIVADPSQVKNTVEQLPADTGDKESGVAPEDAGPVFSTLPVDNPKFYDVVNSFMDRLRDQMSCLREAVQMQNDKGVREVTHWLRGSGGSVGYENFATLCSLLENTGIHESTLMQQALNEIEAYCERVYAGWELTPTPGTDDGRTV